MSQSTIRSVSFESSSAVQEGDGFIFEAHGASIKPSRVQLASIELPTSQQSIEPEWSHVHFHEKMTPQPDARKLKVRREYAGRDKETVVDVACIYLPLEMNPIVEIVKRAELGEIQDTYRLSVRTKFQHGLWSGTKPIIDGYAKWDGRVELIGASFGPRVLYEKSLQRVDDYTFVVDVEKDVKVVDSQLGWLHAPAPPSPAHTCSLINACITGSVFPRGHAVLYNAHEHEYRLQVETYPEGADEVRFAISGDSLALRLGFSNGMNERVFRRALMPQTQGMRVSRQDDAVPLVMTGSSVQWPHVCLRPGWYTPTRRSYSTSQPQRLQAEFNLQFNRLTMSASDNGSPSLVMIDTSGELKVMPLPCGRFTPVSFALAVNDVLDKSVAGIKLAFASEKFQFSSPEKFAIIFTHPVSIEATRLGFEEIVYDGRRTYTGHAIISPQTGWSPSSGMSATKNVYSCTDSSATDNKLQIVTSAPPAQLSIIDSHSGGVITLRFVHGSRRSGHGLEVGDIVRLAKPSICDDPSSILNPQGARAVVASIDSYDRAVLHTQHSPWLRVGGMILVRYSVSPSNFCFSPKMTRSIGSRLGFPERTIQHGIDGHHHFQAGSVHNLDHPDYVLIFLSTGKPSTTNIHIAKGRTSSPFAKVVLYPGYREERALTRELILTSGEDFSRFKMRITNPDLSPYKMHGATFSFTLNYIVPLQS